MLVTAVIAVAMASTVTLPTVAGAETSHAQEPMPNFLGMGRASVYAEMYSAQLYFKTVGPGANTHEWVRVVGEIPAAGTLVAPLSTVILDVTTAPAVAAVVHHPVATVTNKTVTKKVVAVHHTTARHAIKEVALTRRTSTKAAGRKKTVRVAGAPYRDGVATWYSYIPGQCASWYLPRGTRVTVVDLDNGRSISCVVTDREAAHGERVVDLSETQFSDLAPLGVGVVRVRVTW
jgi:rare lipoprotein A (peptidoglycan hydrolase)